VITTDQICEGLLRELDRLWLRDVDVSTQEGCDVVTEIYRSVGWGWQLDRHWPDGRYRYVRGDGVDWCGHVISFTLQRLSWDLFARECLTAISRHKLGLFVDPHKLQAARRLLERGQAVLPDLYMRVLPSTSRIRGRGPATSQESLRRLGGSIVETSPRPGAVAVLQSRSHFVVLEEDLGDGVWRTIEGNALGDGPHGRIRGLIRREREESDLLVCYAFTGGIFEAEAVTWLSS
jgi:hypothetical protein